eukprot:667038-Alexandrium_andersonii.AAC.1
MVATPVSQVPLAARSRMIVESGSGRYEAGSRPPVLLAGLWPAPWASPRGGPGCARDAVAWA